MNDWLGSQEYCVTCDLVQQISKILNAWIRGEAVCYLFLAIFTLFSGAETFGFLAVLLTVPVTATLGVLAQFWLDRYLQSPVYLDPPRRNL